MASLPQPSLSPALQAAIPLRPYQLDWVRDKSRNKIAVKSRRIGYTFGTTLEIADDAADRRTKWRIVSRTQDTAKEAMVELGNHFAAMQMAEKRFKGYGAELAIDEKPTDLFFGDTRVMKFEAHLPNKSVVTAMTAHPDALRGFGGNVLLDEFAFAMDSVALWRGASAATILGHRLVVVSTPNFQQGKFFDLCRAAGMADGVPPQKRQNGIWSCHLVDVQTAVSQGFPVSVDYCRELAGDEDTFLQEYCCVFLADGECFISFELIEAAESAGATLECDLAACRGRLHLGMDIGRRKDRTVIWVLEEVGDVLWTRKVVTLARATFAEQEAALYALLPYVQRACIDSTGIGMQLAERAQAKFGGKVEAVEFTQATKESMALEGKKVFEERRIRIPFAAAIRRAINAVKRYVGPTGKPRFDAARTEAGHADEFWSLMLAISAAWKPRSSMRDARMFGTPISAGILEGAF